jgi:hypothetical protein
MMKLAFVILTLYWPIMATAFFYPTDPSKGSIIQPQQPHDALIQNNRLHLIPETYHFKITAPTFGGDQNRVGTHTRVAAAEHEQQSVILIAVNIKYIDMYLILYPQSLNLCSYEAHGAYTQTI